MLASPSTTSPGTPESVLDAGRMPVSRGSTEFHQAPRHGGRMDTMRLGLIGSTGHWQTYSPALKRVPDLTLIAVAAAGPEETTGAFDHAPGLTVDTRRYDDARKLSLIHI